MRRIERVEYRNSIEYAYDQNGKLFSISGPNGRKEWFDENENMIKARDGDGTTEVYSPDGRLAYIETK